MKIETVKIIRKDSPGGYVIINASDQKPTDKIYQEPKGRASHKEDND